MSKEFTQKLSDICSHCTYQVDQSQDLRRFDSKHVGVKQLTMSALTPKQDRERVNLKTRDYNLC
jgi:hypothetical protein